MPRSAAFVGGGSSAVSSLSCQLVSSGSRVKNFPQVGDRIDAAPPAALHEGVEDRSALTGSGVADEQPVLLE